MLAAFLLTWFYRASTYRIFDNALANTVTSLIATADIDDQGVITLSSEPLDPRFQRALSGHYWVIGRLDAEGQVMPLTASRSLAEEVFTFTKRDADFIRTRPGADMISYVRGPNENEDLRVVARSVILPGANAPVVMLAATDYSPVVSTIRRFALMATGLFFLISVGLIAAIFAQVRVGLRPVFQLREQVANVREGVIETIEGDYPREIEPLAKELNSLIAHNKDVVERARTHVSNLAHALKTPLAVLLNESQMTKDKDFADVVTRQSLSMQKQVSHHLDRARVAARGQTLGTRTQIKEVIDPLERTLRRIYQDKNLDITVTCSEDLMFRGERRDLEDMVGNLLDNACKWSRGKVRVQAALKADDEGILTIAIEDNGPGLDPADYEKALGRGVRLDETTPGTGFGLSIVDDLARAYKGALVLSRSEMGGLKTMLGLPSARAQS